MKVSKEDVLEKLNAAIVNRNEALVKEKVPTLEDVCYQFMNWVAERINEATKNYDFGYITFVREYNKIRRVGFDEGFEDRVALPLFTKEQFYGKCKEIAEKTNGLHMYVKCGVQGPHLTRDEITFTIDR